MIPSSLDVTPSPAHLTMQDVRAWFVHLRLNFQFYLSPIFLWGFVLADGHLDGHLLLGYLAFHLFGYAGGTAFNSYYDRDAGPIGGLEHPPPVPRGLLPFALVWQLIGFVIALTMNLSLAAIYAIMFVLSAAYSHPRTRFKAKPLAAFGTVALGQGVLAFLGGWVCAHGEVSALLTLPTLLGMSAATLITVGFYPLTEIYQMAEDSQRGDKTLAIWLGPAGAFRFALLCLVLGGLAAIGLILLRYQPLEALVLLLFLVGMFIAIWRWSRAFGTASIAYNFRMAMRLYAFLSIGFIGWIGLHLVGLL